MQIYSLFLSRNYPCALGLHDRPHKVLNTPPKTCTSCPTLAKAKSPHRDRQREPSVYLGSLTYRDLTDHHILQQMHPPTQLHQGILTIPKTTRSHRVRYKSPGIGVKSHKGILPPSDSHSIVSPKLSFHVSQLIHSGKCPFVAVVTETLISRRHIINNDYTSLS